MRRKRIKVAAQLLFCCKRHSPKGCFGELFEDNNGSGKHVALTVLLIAYIGSKGTPPYFPLVKKYRLRFLMEHSFFLMPLFKILFHEYSNVSTSIISISSLTSMDMSYLIGGDELTKASKDFDDQNIDLYSAFAIQHA
jgi:hypothetical protein